MGAFDLELQRERIAARLSGELTTESAATFCIEMLGKLEQGEEVSQVVIDFRELTGCGIFARSELIKMQRGLKAANCRTAYIANVARFRGLAMWVVNIAEDQAAKVCFHDEMAQAWLTATGTRVAQNKHRTISALDAQKHQGAT